jgi:hypothetical protein
MVFHPGPAVDDDEFAVVVRFDKDPFFFKFHSLERHGKHLNKISVAMQHQTLDS